MLDDNYPVLRFTPDYVEVVEDFTHLGITVPAGFKRYDGNSVPLFLSPVLGSPFRLKTLRASLLHDFLYESHQGREYADNKYYEALKYDKVNLPWIYYLGVRIFGGLKYK